MPLILITPEVNLSPDVAPVYYKFIQRSIKHNDYYLRANLNYSYPDGYMFRFSTSVLLCPVMQNAEPLMSESGEYYQHHLGAELGNGGFGVVWKISHTRKLDPVGFKTAGYETKQVVKIQTHCECSPSKEDSNKHHHNPINVYQEKYSEFLRHIIHLGTQKPLYNPKLKKSYTVMNELFGDELFTHLYGFDEQHEPEQLSPKKRLEYCFGILWAVKDQVSRYDVIHRDIKPENIKIKLFPSPINESTPNPVSIYDYDLGLKIPLLAEGVAGKPNVGTISYIAPECLMLDHQTLAPRLLTKKIDVFATGRVLLEILNGCDDGFNNEQDSITYWQYLQNKQSASIDSLSHLSHKLDPLSQQDHESIKSLLRKMLELDPIKRITIEEAYSEFMAIYNPIIQTVLCDKDTNREDEFALDLLSMGSNEESESESEPKEDFNTAYERLINKRPILPPIKSPLLRRASNRPLEHTLFYGAPILEEEDDEEDKAPVESAIQFPSSPASSSTASALRSLSQSPSVRLMQSRLPSIAEDRGEEKLPLSPVKSRQSPFKPIAGFPVRLFDSKSPFGGGKDPLINTPRSGSDLGPAVMSGRR